MAQNVFFLEEQGKTILFSPLHGLIMEINGEEKNLVSGCLTNGKISSGDLLKIFPNLNEQNLFSEEQNVVVRSEISADFLPESGTIFTTFDCSLRCIYCYSEAGKKKGKMDIVLAKHCVDFLIGNAVKKGSKNLFLEFHGGGEPTFNWEVFSFSLEYFVNEAARNNLVAEPRISTNGVLSAKQVAWIAGYKPEVQVSFDGFKEIQNKQRPTAGGGGSFSVVSRTIKSFLERGININIHSVITDNGVNRIPEIVTYFVREFPGVPIHLEPAFSCGRGLSTGQSFPSSESFIEGLLEAQEIGNRNGVKVFYSGVDSDLVELHESFCGVVSPNFVVTPDGLVTACHEISSLDHPLSEMFIYGRFNREKEIFEFDAEKIKILRSYVDRKDPACSECLANLYCAGECLVKNVVRNNSACNIALNPRCGINRGLIRQYILREINY
jgi:uncharacterized protein